MKRKKIFNRKWKTKINKLDEDKCVSFARVPKIRD